MDAPDGLIGKSLSVKLGSEEPAVLLEIGVELLDVVGGQLSNWILPSLGIMC